MSLKDALLKAGLKPTKSENERDFKPKREKKNSEKHQFARNYCEVCQSTQPDVEKFNHRNRLIDAKWICVNCADKNEIHDDFRVTDQSDFATQNKYRRYYGPTRNLKKEANSAGKGKRPNNNSKSRNPNEKKNFNR